MSYTPRLASTVMNVLPWEDRLVALILINGNEVLFANGTGDKREIARRAAEEHLTLLAAWPGYHSQDIFLVDDLPGAREYLDLSVAKASDLRYQRDLEAGRL